MLRIEVMGNLGADAEIKNVNGSQFVSFRVADTAKFTDSNGNAKESTQWVDVTYNNVESKVVPYLKRGVKVFVRGNGSTRVYSSKAQRTMVAGLRIHATEIELCGGSSDIVPRELVQPDNGQCFAVSKLYWSADCPKGKRSDWTQELIDKNGNRFQMDFNGFISPIVQEANEPAE